MRRSAAVFVAVLLTVGQGTAQGPVQLTSSLLYERYDFDAGLSYSAVSELSVPVTAVLGLGRWGDLAVSGGFARVSLTGEEGGSTADQTVSGLVDTEARLSVEVVPDRLVVLATGSIPTGVEAVDIEEQPALAAISTEVLGFSTTNLGIGGSVGGGLAGAVPAGRMALGFAGSYTHSVAFQPVLGSPRELKPGGELRLRAGIEGPLGDRTYLRAAGIYAARQNDQIDAIDANGMGDRISAYISLDQGLGPASLTVYAFDSYRADPQIEPTALGSAILPRGNVLAVGLQATIPVARETRLTPRAEYRRSDRATEPDGDDLERLGSSMRFGADVRHPVSRELDVVLEASGLVGSTVLEGNSIDVSGFRFGIHLEVSR